MKILLRKNDGVTLVMLMTMVIIMVVLSTVSVSLIDKNVSAKEQLYAHGDKLDDLIEESNVMQENIRSELNNDYDSMFDAMQDDVVKDISTEEEWDGTINKPKLADGMTAIYFENGVEKILTTSSTQDEWNNWYNYAEKKWANAKTEDGSYWVWIPRFAYRITNNLYTSTSGNISVVFVNDENKNANKEYKEMYPNVFNNSMRDYVVHPAFCSDLENGGTNGNISGFWIAKYEMSREDSSNGGDTWASATGADVLTKNAGSSSSIRVVSKPSVSSWRNITIGNAYKNAYYYNRDADSHLIKNSEWGAVAYLAQSAYGIDGIEVAKNDSTGYITAVGGVSASSTGNETGVYDMNGGAYEYVAAYIVNAEAQSIRNEYGASFSGSTASTKYSTIYSHDLNSDTAETNWTSNKGTKYGDAIVEVSTAGTGNSAWNSDTSVYPYLESSYFVRGGKYSDTGESSGIFAFDRSKGSASVECSYRVVLF